MSASQFQLRPAHLTDLPSIAQVWSRAFFDDEIIGTLMHPYRNIFPNDIYYFLLRGIRERFFDWRHQFIVVTTHNGDIVGAADWRRLGTGGQTRGLWTLDPRSLMPAILHTYHALSLRIWPNRAADPSRASFLDSAVAKSERHWTGDRAECWDLHVCGVDPKFQGKGIGRMLAEWGVESAKKEGEGVVASVLCGEKNRGFYGKAGLGTEVGASGNVVREGGGIVLFTR
ncbi:acyl-CoA N-acyltransferase [Ophiobolus disseminans]|uniref:Acyl-CoA N-acyltransferase n=1 Tax=Ophiobolus disseminans TaxID=1469910 RepID=A0A6A6ZVJ1_9PLEO|nr:acyl-CoA N-acyltransferase [Ophiobolus disseminans]